MTPRRSIRMLMLFGSTALAFTLGSSAPAGFPAEKVVLRSHLPLADFDAEFAEDCWGYVSDSGREYAIIGVSTGTAFVEITDPDNPVIVEIILTSNQGRDMKVYQNYVYTSSDSGPTHVIDVSDIDNGNVTLVNTLDGGTHNMFINEQSGFLYLSIGGPMVVADLIDPINPVLAGIWDSEAHDATVVTYAEGPYAGREIAFVFAGWQGRLDIVDVTDKSDMFLLGSTTYPSAAYTHQGWLTEDRQHLYVSDEIDGIPRTTIIDVGDLTDPTFISDFTTGLDSTDHNLYVHEGFIFEANYTSGLRIFDAADPVNPVEVGYFDTYPPSNDAGFDGAWSVYPFFPSGMAIVSDRPGGLFVLDPSAAVGGCDADTDGDGVCDPDDPCPLDNPDDTDGDGVCDSDDPCPLDNPDDTDGDGVCDSNDICPGGNDKVDTDGDGTPDFCDPCPLDNPDDSDDDGVCDSDDNCPDHSNADQADCDDDGVGDVCAIADGLSEDCNENAIPDECDINDETSSDDNNNGIPDECECPADFDDDGSVTAADLATLLGAWGANPGHPADFDGDGFVGAADLAQLLGDWGPCV